MAVGRDHLPLVDLSRGDAVQMLFLLLLGNGRQCGDSKDNEVHAIHAMVSLTRKTEGVASMGSPFCGPRIPLQMCCMVP
jgi:hypothetical protein